MKKAILILLLSYLTFSGSNAQTFDEVSFLHNLKTSYYLLNDRPVENFVVKITSAKLDAFTKENFDTTGLPILQLIWQKPADVFLSEFKFPFEMNIKQKAEYRELVDALKIQVKGIFLDLQRFYINGLLNETLMNNYILRHTEEAVQMTFKNIDQQGTNVKYLLGLNALCILIDIEYPNQNKHMLIYPDFQLIDTKWLCHGWTVQTMVNGEVQSGFKLTIEYEKVNEVQLPIDFFLEVQKSDEKDKIYFDEIRFIDYKLNQKIEIKTK